MVALRCSRPFPNDAQCVLRPDPSQEQCATPSFTKSTRRSTTLRLLRRLRRRAAEQAPPPFKVILRCRFGGYQNPHFSMCAAQNATTFSMTHWQHNVHRATVVRPVCRALVRDIAVSRSTRHETKGSSHDIYIVTF